MPVLAACQLAFPPLTKGANPCLCLGVPEWPHFGVPTHACFSADASIRYEVAPPIALPQYCTP